MADAERERDEWKDKFAKLDKDYQLFRDESAEVDKMLEEEIEEEKRKNAALNKELEKVSPFVMSFECR